MKHRIAFAAMCIFASSCALGIAQERPAARTRGGAAVKAETPEVWLCHGNWKAYLEGDGQWDFVQKNLDGFQFYVDAMTKANPEKLAALVKILKENDIDTSVELGGCLTMHPLDDTVGEKTATMELKKLKKLIEATGGIDYYNMDGPIRRIMNDPMHPKHQKRGTKPYTSLDAAAEQVVGSMKVSRAAMPDLNFFLLSNFPNWGYKGEISYTGQYGIPEGWGDYHKTVQAVIAHTRKAGIPIQGVTVDFPYDYLIGETKIKRKDAPDIAGIDWLARVRDLEDYVESEGLEFNLIVNSQRGGKTSAKMFCEETLAYIDLYKAAGGSPKRYFVQSWYKFPNKAVPETEPYTMTWLLREAIKKVKGI